MTQNPIEAFIQSCPEPTRDIQYRLLEIVRECCPTCTEKIGYGIPTFVYKKTNLIHFAGYAKHIGIYPGADGIEAFKDRIQGYVHAKGSVQFPLNEAMPYDLFREMVLHNIAQIDMRAKK